MRDALARFNWLQECIIRGITWREPEMGLLVELSYIWTDDGRICFEAEAPPRALTLDFSLVDRLAMRNAINSAMLAQPQRLDWGVSEIARVEVSPLVAATGEPDFAVLRFVWEGIRSIEVVFRDLRITLECDAGPLGE